MDNWEAAIWDSLKCFYTILPLTRIDLDQNIVEVNFMKAPHTPPATLPKGKCAVYAFWHEGEWLKIGRVGPNSQARYTSHHYSQVSSGSNLANSLKSDKTIQYRDFDQNAPGNWIKAYCSRVNIILPEEYNSLTLPLLEAFLHARLLPRYEGKQPH